MAMTITGSKSSEKLEILMDGLSDWPVEAFARIKSASITWEYVDEVVVPVLSMEYYER